MSLFCDGNRERGAAVLVLYNLSTTNPSLGLFVQFKMFGNGITADAFKHKFSQLTHVQRICYAIIQLIPYVPSRSRPCHSWQAYTKLSTASALGKPSSGCWGSVGAY